jgi:hypothetical protein
MVTAVRRSPPHAAGGKCDVVFRIKETVNLRAARLEQRGHPRLGEKKSFYTRGKAVARLALAEMDSRTPLFRERLWPHLEARPRCSLPQLAVERT